MIIKGVICISEYRIKDIDSAIIGFRGQYSFLSNMYEGSMFEYRGLRYKNVEAAFQSRKNTKREQDFEMLTGKEAKQLGRHVALRKDWEQVKYGIMYEIVYLKFTKNKELQAKLLETDDRELIELNTWNDKTWGVVYNSTTKKYEGDNMLGKILMGVREAIRHNYK